MIAQKDIPFSNSKIEAFNKIIKANRKLKGLEDSGYIDLYFGDQSYFGLTPNVPYAWQTKENPILLPADKGKYQNVVGLMTHKNKLE